MALSGDAVPPETGGPFRRPPSGSPSAIISPPTPTTRRPGELRAWSAHARRGYLAYTRRYLGWGVFILRAGG
ncbi:hypothetical protein OG871_07515 [Kitasatospora sp. NBC_00374]|uniref:hypothetical protein n=1 Tax=Kitasatospora sp. NBC_00374 TaxID=2975964 RepID=UPI0030E4687C